MGDQFGNTEADLERGDHQHDRAKEDGNLAPDPDKRWWGASAIRTGTNERMWEEAATKEELDTKLFGQAYGAKYGSVTYYRIEKRNV